MSQDDVFITDIAARVVGGLPPARGKGAGWVPLTFSTETFDGAGVSTGAGSGAPELAIDLGLQGEYVIYVALAQHSALRARLDGDSGYREFVVQQGSSTFQECRLHRADLTGRRLHISAKPAPRAKPATLAYVRAVRADHQPARPARNVVATNDGWSYLALDGFRTADDVRRMFLPLRDSDVSRMLYGPVGADLTTNPFTRVGTFINEESVHAYRQCDVDVAQAARNLRRTHTDPLALASQCCDELGIELHWYIRPQAFGGAFPWDGMFDSRFMIQNPHLRCIDEFGETTLRMSYAHPRVQDQMFAYIDELLAYNPRGVCLAFNRSLPMMICEPPVLEAFARKHGRASRLPDECDSPEMIAVRQDLLHAYLQRLHDHLQRAGGKTLSFIVDGDGEHNAKWGLDLQRAVDAGLVHSLYCTGPCDGSAFWRGLRDQGKVEIYPTGRMWRADYSQPELARSVRDRILDAGFNGPFFWDIETEFENPYNWHLVRHIGSRGFLEKVITGEIPTPTLRPYTRINGVKIDRYHPNRSY